MIENNKNGQFIGDGQLIGAEEEYMMGDYQNRYIIKNFVDWECHENEFLYIKFRKKESKSKRLYRLFN